jgi:hypothetical protein
LTRKYIAPFLFLYKNRAIGHGVQYKSNGQYQNLALQIEIPTARTLIDRLELSGKMVQLDSMHCIPNMKPFIKSSMRKVPITA